MYCLRPVYSDTTQLNSTSSWVELCRYKRDFRHTVQLTIYSFDYGRNGRALQSFEKTSPGTKDTSRSIFYTMVWPIKNCGASNFHVISCGMFSSRCWIKIIRFVILTHVWNGRFSLRTRRRIPQLLAQRVSTIQGGGHDCYEGKLFHWCSLHRENHFLFIAPWDT